jgi:hypothetical protein
MAREIVFLSPGSTAPMGGVALYGTKSGASGISQRSRTVEVVEFRNSLWNDVSGWVFSHEYGGNVGAFIAGGNTWLLEKGNQRSRLSVRYAHRSAVGDGGVYP